MASSIPLQECLETEQKHSPGAPLSLNRDPLAGHSYDYLSYPRLGANQRSTSARVIPLRWA